MKASEVIVELQKLIEQHGDCDTYYWDGEQITGHGRVEEITVSEYSFGNITKIFKIY